MNEQELYADVILPFALPQLFTYAVPESLHTSLAIGKRAVVQFGKKRFYTSIIAKIHNLKPVGYETKEILSILDEKPVVNPIQFKFWEWISKYYMCTLGEVMKAALPAGLKLESETQVFFNPAFENIDDLSSSEELVLTFIQNKKHIGIHEIKITGLKLNVVGIINNLLLKEAIFLEESLKSGYSAKTETYIKLTVEASDEIYLTQFLESLKRAKKQQELILNYIQLSGIFSDGPIAEVSKRALLEISGSGSSALKQLCEKNIFQLVKTDVSRLGNYTNSLIVPFELNDKQTEAKDNIINSLETYDVVLLHGVTGSGKTEIYIHLIHEMLEKGKQVLYLLPEIAITAQIINRLKNHFGNKVGIYHSKFSDNERVETWNKLNLQGNDRYQIILGVRSSVFLPFTNLGLVIVDEEHESSFKQFDPAPRYHARDSVIVLAKYHNAKVLLGTATPSVESYFNAQSGKYGLVNLNDRYKDMKMPEIKIANVRAAKKSGHLHTHFTRELLNNISICLEKEKQIILFQNRRGFSPYIECLECGWIPRCKHCDVTLTYHKFQNQLVCHYCGYSNELPKTCSTCKSTNIQTHGFGTEKIEEELAIHFPTVRIARMDLDATRQKHAHEKIIAQFEQHQTDILVGTQMVTKGLDFAKVGLVGILDADSILNYPDFRAFERGFQLMTQVGGRAGRKDEQGLVLIQTSTPGHPIIQFVLKNNYIGMYTEQIEERKQFKYPPFVRLIKLSVKHKNSELTEIVAQQLFEKLKHIFGQRVFGPDMPIVSKIQQLHIRQIMIKIEREANIAKAKERITECVQLLSQQNKMVQFSIDVDPA